MALSEKAQATRNRILAAATKLFYLHGYNATGLDKILKEAGTTKGNFYYHFKSKEALALASLDSQLTLILQALQEQVLSKHKSPLETLFGILNFMANKQKIQHREGYICGCYFGNFTLELSTVSDPIKQKVKHIFDQYMGLIESLLIKAKEAGEIPAHIDPATMSSIIMGQAEGAILLDKANQEPKHFDQSIHFIKQVLST
jgi:TetR/AcrR family transcriptional repressor of nem operon